MATNTKKAPAKAEAAPARSAPSAPSRRTTIEDVIGGLLHWDDTLFGREGRIKVEELDIDDAHVVRAEIPGVDPDKDIEVTLDRELLTIRAERRSERTSEEQGYRRSEFSYGSFSRTLPVPAGATENDIKATYTDGILEVRVPIPHGREPDHRIPVSRA